MTETHNKETGVMSERHTPLTDAFVANKTPTYIGADLVSTGKSVRATIIAWHEFASTLECDRADLLVLLREWQQLCRNLVHFEKDLTMPQSFILYSALSQLTFEHCVVVDRDEGAVIYIRAELVDCDHNEAMDRVKPMEGETFLNCVPVEKS